MPVIARSPEGQVTSLWGTALIRGADGKLRMLKVGDIVRQGDQILTTQDGIVQIANGDAPDAPVQAADAKKAPEGDEIDRVITGLNTGDREVAPAAGLAGGGDGSLEAGLRVDRINEGVGGFQIPSGTGDADIRRVDVAGGTTTPPEDRGVRTPTLDAPSSTISAAEEGAPTNLGLTAPAGNGTIRVDQVPTIGEIRKADGTLVTAGTVLTPADLPGLVYVPPSEYDGVIPAGNFGYTLTVDGQTVTGGTTIDLSPVNDAPVATPASASGNEDGTLPLSLGGTDVDGTIVGVTVTRLPAGGTLFLADGVTPVGVGQTITPAQAATLVYKPGADFNGDQTIQFTVTDNGGATSAPATVSLTVVAVNDAPVASIGSGGSGNEDTPIAVNLGGTDVDGTVTSVTVTRLPGNGTLFLADGVTPVAAGATLTPAQAAGLVFVPAANFNGNVTIGFTVTDNEGAVSRPVNAVVTVNPVNDAPVAQADSATLAEDSVATGNVLGNDSDVDGPSLSVSSFSIGGTSFAAGSTAIVGGVGTLTMNADGSWTFTPAANFNGPVPAIQVTVSDGSLSATSALSLTVTPVNDAPVASSSTITVAEESANTPLGLTAPTDVDGNALTITVTGLPSVGTITLADGTPVVNGQVLTAAQLAGLQFDAPADLLASTSTSFSYTVSDGTVTVNAGTTINVTPVNDAPVASSSTITVAEESANTPLGLSAPTDVDGNALTITITGLPAVGTITLADGTPVVNGQVLTAAQLAGLQFDAPADLLASTSTSFTYTVSDGTVTVNAGTTINVTPVNDAPVASSSTITVAEESANTPLGLTAPTDVDGNALTITVTGLPAVGTITLANGTPVTNGQVLTAAQLAGLQFDAPADLLSSTSTSFSYTVSDGTVTVNAGTTINVTPVNDAPVASSSTITVAEESANTPLGLTAPTDVDGNPLTITVTGLPSVGTVTLADGTPVANGQVLTAAQLAGLQFDAPADLLASTSTSFSYTVSDGTVTVNAGTTINVTPANDAPVASSSTITVAEESANTSLGLSAPTDVDGNPLTITVTGLPSVGTITLADGTPVTNGQVLTAAQLAGLQFDAPADLLASTSTSFTYTVSDGTVTVNAGATINVTPVNDAPVAVGDTAVATEDTALVLAAATLLANDSDVDGDTLSIVSVQGAVNGTVALVGGNVVFTPVAGYNGPASFTYTVSDGRGGSSIATVNLTVTPDNDNPVAVGDIVGPVNEDNPLTITPATLLGNDSDPDGDSLSIQSVQGAVNGTVALVGGNVVFTPNANYNGPASFTYTVSDGNGGTSTATVNLTVNPVNDDPVANPDFFTTGEDSPITITLPSLLANDTDVDGDTLQVFLASNITNGTLSVVGGNLVFTPNANYSGPASFTYSITDGHGGISTATVNINVTPANDAPVASSSTITVAEESANTPLGLTAPIDVDGDAMTITVTGLPSVGTVTLADGTPVTNGQVLTAAQLAGLQFDAPADLLAATSTSFSYTVSDGTVTVNAGTTINVNPVNDNPVANADSFTTAEDTPITITLPSLLANDTDVDGDTLSVVFVSNPANGTLSIVGGNLVFTPNANYNGPASFTYGISDGHGGVATSTVNINVTPGNDAPVASSSTITVAEESANTPLGLTAPTDIDGDALTITVTGLPSVGTITLADGTPVTNGQVLTAAQLAGLQFDAPADLLSSTSTSFSYTVSDGIVTVNAGTTINVTPVNDAPVASSSTITVAEESANTPLGLTAPTDADGNALTITVTGLPSVGTVTLANGTPVVNGQMLTAAQLAGLQFDAPADLLSSTSTSFTYTVSDGTVTVNAGTTINVTPVNDAPVASNSSITVAEESANTSLGLTAPTDVDGNPLTITVTGLPSVGTVTLADGTPVTNGQVLTAAQLTGLQFDAPADLLASTSTSFSYTVSDGTVTVSAGTTINVTPVNDAPVASNDVASTTINTPLASIPVLANDSDIDGDSLTVTAATLVNPALGSVSINPDGTLAFTPATNISGPVVINYTIGDGHGGTSSATLTVNVGANTPPQGTDLTVSLAEDGSRSFSAADFGFSDADAGQSLAAVRIDALPGAGTLLLNGNPIAAGTVVTAAQLAAGALVFAPAADANGNAYASFGFSVQDNVGAFDTSSNTITIDVLPVNDAPVASSSTITVAEESANTPLGLTAPTDVDGDALTITVTGLPSVGTITLANGTPVTNGQVLTAAQLAGLQFDAPADLLASTSTSFSYTVSDGTVTVNAGTTISVTPVNDAPVASSSTITVAEESANTPLGLTAPTDVDGNSLTITVTGLPSVGSVTLANGTPVTNGQVLTAAQLAGLQFDAPADLLASTSTSFSYTVSDGTVTVNAGTTINVTPVNDAPVASSSTITVAEESANTPLGLTAPTDVDGNALTITVTGLPTVGTVTLADGTPVTNGQVLTAAQLAGLQFDAPADLLASTSTSFSYTVSDGTVTVNAGTTISVTPVNDAPVASSSTITVAEESANTPLGLSAPTDVDGNALTITVTGLPAVGTITLANGTPVTNGQVLTAAQLAGLQFDAPADLLTSTSTSFSYTVSDGTVTVNAGTTINVTPVNDAPVASSSIITVAEESANTPLGLSAPTDVDGNALTITVTGLPSVGTVTLANGTPVVNGQVLTAAQLAGLQFDAPADLLASTSTSFSYTVSDGTVTVNAGTTINVTPVNDAPVASSSTISVAEESANTPLGLIAPTDVDGNPLTITVTGLPSVGTITLADGSPVANGQVLTAAQLAGLQFDAPADLLASTATSFSYTVSDGTVTVNAGTTINVTPVNDAPVASSSTITVAEESANTPLGLSAPTDVDGNALTITVTGLPSVGTVTLADGTPVTNGQVLTAAQLAGLQFDAPADLLASTSTSFSYTVSDGTVTVNAGTTINVTPVNDAPVASSSTITVAEESANTPLGLTAPTDVDGNALTITVTGLPSVGTITLANGTPVTNGQVLTAAQLAGLQFDAPSDLLASTSTSFSYTVSDGTVTVNAGTTISVTPVNDAPVASSSTITVAEESVNTPLGLATPTDVDGNTLTITVTGLPSVGTITLANGTPVTNGQVLTAAQLAGLQFDAPADLLASTSTSFSYTVSDGTVTVNAGTTISVTPVNDAPVASSSTITVAEESVNTPLGLTAPTDVDGNSLTITVTGLPGVGTVTLANGTPIINGQVLTAAQLAGLQFDAPADLLSSTSTSFSYTVSDGTVTVNAGTTISVTPVNDAPVASSSTITVAEESANTPLGLTAPTDVDGNSLTITVTGLPSVGTITLANGTPVTNGQVLTAAQLAGLQFDAPADLLASTSTSFSYTVSDGTVTVNAGTTINVTPVNDAPVASSSTITVAEESANTPLGLTAPTDVDGNALTITVTGLPSVGTVTLANGTPVVNGQVLTAAQLAGLQFDAPADLLASTSTSFSYTVSDGTVTVNAGTTINVTPVNDAPVASSSTITVAEESANTPLGLTAPTDADGNPLTITVTGLPSVGAVTLANGTPVTNGQVLTAAQLAGLQFDAPADLLSSTSASFTYTVSDGTVTVNAGTTINVTPVNDAPVASSSTITVAEESANTPLGLTAPTDVDGNPLTITVTGLPSVGTVTLANGTPVTNGQVLTAAQLAGLQFDAPADLLASTSTSFSYTVSDGTVTVNAGTTISVTPVNDAPVASSSTITVAEESANTPLGLTAPTDVDGNTLTITVTGLPSVGTITLANGTPVTNGQVLTAAQLAGLQFDAPADLLASTSTSFSYTVSDGTVTVNAGTTINVTPINDAPVASSSTITVAEESADTPLGLTAPTDVDGNALTITVTGLPSVGTVTLANGTPVTNGQVLTAAQLAGLQFDAPSDLLASTSTSFSYTVSDGTVTVNAGTTINVTPVNDAPVAQPSSFTVAEDATVVNGAVTATDVDAGATFSYALNGAAPAGLTFNANGTYSFNPANVAYQSLAFGQSQVITVPYTVTDNAGATSTANLVITVTGTNDAPVAQAAAFSVAEDAAVVTGSVTATDVDSGATRTFVLNGTAPAGLTFNANGSYSFDPANAAYQSLRVGQSTVITVPYTVTDDRGASSTANLVITVTGTNDAPVAVADSGSLAENATLTTTAATGVLANDTDVDSGDSRTVSAISFGASNGSVGSALNGTYGALTLNADGSYSYVANRPAAEALTAGQVVTESFTYTMRDGAGATSQATITFTITGANDAPTITGPLTGAVREDTTLSTGGTLVVTDPDAGQSSFVAQTATAGTYGSFAITAGGVWTYTLNNSAANVQSLAGGTAVTEDFIVRSADGTQRTITVTVNGTNDAPVAQARSFTVAEDAAVVTGSVTATDVDAGATLAFALNGAAPAGLTFNANGSYSFDPSNAAYQALGFGQQQVITVPYTVSDGAGGSSTANLVITVTGTNDAPVANANSGPATEDTVLTIVPATLLANDTDVDSGDTLSITSVQGAVNGTVALSGGNIVFTPTANYSGSASFTYTVTDSRGATSTATVTLNVGAVADAPTLVINGSSSTGGTTTPAVLPAATGLVRDFFQDIASVSTANAGNIATVETAVESSTRTSTSVVTDISIPDLNVDDAYRYTGFIYLTAGQTYEITGSRDDTLAVKLGGNSVYGVGYNNWGAFTASGFTPSVSGYYSLEVIAYNGDGVGTLDINMSVNGAAAVDLNTTNFRIYTSASDFSSSPTVAGPLVPNGDGGYYPGGAGGTEDTAIRLGNIAASLNDTDGSETLSVRIGSIPVGAVISDGTNSFTATAGNTSVLVTGWSLNNLTITPPLHYAGTINLSVTATATEASGPTATTTGTLPVLVTAVADAPVVAGDTLVVSMVQGSGTAATVNFPIHASLVDTDGSETLRVLVSGVPTGATFSAGTNNGSGVWEFSAAQLDGLTMTLPAGTSTSGTTLTVTAVSREGSTGAEASDSSTITLVADYTTSTTGGASAGNDNLSGNGNNNFINALGGNDTVSGGGGNDYVLGGAGNDSINGGTGNDALWGEAGNDIILGGTGSDLIRGGAGNDTMTGGATAGAADGTADVFAWSFADAGTAGTPATDTITDFNVGAVSAGGDVLDLRDLLSGDVLGAGNTVGNLANFLDFAVSGSGASATTTIRISSTGQYAGGNYSAAATDQTIVLQGVDLPTSLGLGSGATDAQIVQELLTRGKLIVDSTGG